MRIQGLLASNKEKKSQINEVNREKALENNNNWVTYQHVYATDGGGGVAKMNNTSYS